MQKQFWSRASQDEDEAGNKLPTWDACVEVEIYTKKFNSKEEAEAEGERIKNLLEEAVKN